MTIFISFFFFFSFSAKKNIGFYKLLFLFFCFSSAPRIPTPIPHILTRILCIPNPFPTFTTFLAFPPRFQTFSPPFPTFLYRFPSFPPIFPAFPLHSPHPPHSFPWFLILVSTDSPNDRIIHMLPVLWVNDKKWLKLLH